MHTYLIFSPISRLSRSVPLCSNADFLCEVFCLSSFIDSGWRAGVVIFTAGFDLPHAHTFGNWGKKAGKYQTHSRRHPLALAQENRTPRAKPCTFFHSRSLCAAVVVCSSSSSCMWNILHHQYSSCGGVWLTFGGRVSFRSVWYVLPLLNCNCCLSF